MPFRYLFDANFIETSDDPSRADGKFFLVRLVNLMLNRVTCRSFLDPTQKKRFLPRHFPFAQLVKMVKIAAFACALLVGSVSAFAPASQGSNRNVALNAEKSKALPFMNRPPLLDGSMAGDVGFDPLGLSNIDEVGIDLYWLREAEIKHCRVAMLAVAGIVQVELFGPAPGCEMATAKCQMDAFWQLWGAHPQYIAFALIMIMITEMVGGIAATTGRELGVRAPGDFGLDPLGFAKGTPASLARLQAQEVANGRLAMFAAAGLLVQGCSTHQGGIENLMSALKDNAF